jgi:hypothetical protein
VLSHIGQNMLTLSPQPLGHCPRPHCSAAGKRSYRRSESCASSVCKGRVREKQLSLSRSANIYLDDAPPVAHTYQAYLRNDQFSFLESEAPNPSFGTIHESCSGLKREVLVYRPRHRKIMAAGRRGSSGIFAHNRSGNGLATSK